MWGPPAGVIGQTDGESFVKVGEVRSARVYQSMLHRFYVGRTNLFILPAGQEGLVVFANPPTSSHRTFLQIMSVTSNVNRRTIFWFDVATPLALNVSPKVANTHRGAAELPQTVILFGSAATVPLAGGIDVFQRLLAARQTLLLDQEGKFILEPGHNHAASWPAVEQNDEIDVAFAWWEEPLH